MAGKPNFPPDIEHRAEIRADTPAPGLSALDQERQGSLADEGGWAGAVMESQDESGPAPTTWFPSRPAAARRLGLILAAAVVLVGAVLVRRRRRQSREVRR